MTNLSRRTLLRLAGGSLLSAPLFYVAKPTVSHAAPALIDARPAKRPFGRAIQGNWIVREQPSVKTAVVRKLKRNEVIDILAETTSDESPSAYNKTWYQTSDGWTHSAYVQLSENALNPPLTSLDPLATTWGELTVPFSPARVKPDPEAHAPWTHYFGTTHQIMELVEGADKKPWYRVSDGILTTLWLPAEHLRIVQPDEFTPLSPDVPLVDKRIEVNLKEQTVRAFENDAEVFAARAATGSAFKQADGTVRSFRTIPGEHRVYLKTPSQRMYGGGGAGDSYDLPGIAWISYFTASGIAFHSTYWHNDYGRPRSHGCVNLLPEDAKWIYRWTMPVTPYEQRWTRAATRDEGSLVKVF